MKYNFKAKNQAGEEREGVIEASSKEAALGVLQKNNLFPLSIEGEDSNDLTRTILKYYDRVTDKELVVFFRQLSILIEARVPIVSSLNAIKDQTTSNYMVKVVSQMVNDIEDGMSFSASMEKHSDVFSALTVNIMKAGEASGSLKKSIDYVAANIEKNYTLSQRVISALMYPMIVMIVFFIIGFLVISFILPKLTQVIKDLNADVPWYTQLMMSLGDFMSKYWWAAAIIILGFAGAVVYYLKTEDGKKEWDQVKINLPIVGPIFRYVYITRFSENLEVLLAGGIPIIRALTIVSAVVNNVVYEDIFLKAAEEIKRGGNMSTVFQRNPLIPPMVSHMIKIGEDSGQIDSVLGHISKFYDQETEIMTKNLSTLLEPILMVIIGIAVGFMAVSILLPIYNIAGQIR
ncbi:MAG: type II secretion system F family protein [Candidatus Pacebacteria bacterium]|nr:type II secretion system F family protein [Candidatus Paceibacterota bacterium]